MSSVSVEVISTAITVVAVKPQGAVAVAFSGAAVAFSGSAAGSADVAKVVFQGPPGRTGPVGPPGPVGMIWRDAWSALTAYLPRDVATYAGTSYICTAPVYGSFPPPEWPEYWDMVVEKGETGSTGATGPNGTDAATSYVDSIPDLTLLFNNQLV